MLEKNKSRALRFEKSKKKKDKTKQNLDKNKTKRSNKIPEEDYFLDEEEEQYYITWR